MNDEILSLLKVHKTLSVEQLTALFDHHSGDEFRQLLKALNQLEDMGCIVRNEHNEYMLIENMNMISGILDINKRGFGFVRVAEGEEDIFISASDLKGAFHKDKVLVELKKTQSGSRQEGRIVRILERGQTRIIEHWEKNSKRIKKA